MTANVETPRLDGELAASVAALQTALPEAAQEDAAQSRLAVRLAAARPRRTSVPRRLWLLAAATCASVFSITLLPVLLMAPVLAFADVQRHFREFTTLAMQIDTQIGGRAVSSTVVHLDRAGNVRVDVDRGLSIVINPGQGRMLRLLHDARQAAVQALPAGAVQREESLDWLRELQEFRGQATALSETRVIDGRTAHGFALELGGMRTTLWAGDDGLPLAMQMLQGGLMEMSMRFRFDEAQDPALFDVAAPAGYTMADGDH